MWNQILDQSRALQKYDNVPVLVLGNRHTGKRTLVDGLCQVSKTLLSNKNHQSIVRNKSRVSVLDYAYINSINLNDPDNKINSKMEFFLIDDDHAQSVTELLIHNPNILERMIVIIALDSSKPWTFMAELDKWVSFINQLLAKAGLSISKLDEMKKNVENCFSNYKESSFDKDRKLVKQMTTSEVEQLTIPVPNDILLNNIRVPLIVVATKSDLQSSMLRQRTSEKMAFIQYHLRKFCLNYGGSLAYVSNKNHTNLDILYQYLLHRSYGFSLKFKSQTVNQESIFVPLGSDNLQLLNDSIKISSMPFSQMIPAPVLNKQVGQQISVVDNNEFLWRFAREHPDCVKSLASETESQSQANVSQTNAVQVPMTNTTQFFNYLLGRNGQRQNSSTSQNQ